MFFLLFLLFCSAASVVQSQRGFDIPIQRRVNNKGRSHDKRGGVSGSTGLGNNADVLYTVPIKLGESVAAVNIDTGSSDLWVVSEACVGDACKGPSVTRYPLSAANSTGTDVSFHYGDSTTGTFASGVLGVSTATIAGVAMTDQPFGLVNATNNLIVQYGAAGIFGLGFPGASEVQAARVMAKSGPNATIDDFIRSTHTDGPLLTRIAMTGELETPVFSVTLQRTNFNTNEVGKLTIGKLPDGVDNSSLTWVPVRLYRAEDGGLTPPSFASNEVYPLRWEIDIEGVFLDGKKVQDSTIPPTGVNPGRVTALIDTGNSVIRGPEDMVNSILKAVSPTYDPKKPDVQPTLPCSVPHTMAFQIGGKMFPVDPRDFINPGTTPNDATTCIADNVVVTDAPRVGSLYRWSLGDPFMKSNLVAFHYGNLTHPSVDPPRIGFLSTVPSNAGDLLRQAVDNVKKNGGNFEPSLVVAPTASAATATQTTVSYKRPGMVTRTVSPVPPTILTTAPPKQDNAAIGLTLPSNLDYLSYLIVLLVSFLT